MLNFELEVLSPIHIGSGERITDWEYVIEGNTMKVYPYEYLINQLFEKNPAFLSNLKALMQRQDFNLSRLFSEGVNVGKPLYELEIRARTRTKEVELFIKSLGKPYIPGSEIKGALRTAYIGGLLLEDKNLRMNVENILRNNANNRKALNNFVSSVIEGFFLYPTGKNDAVYDLFKALSVPDMFFELKDLCIEVPQLVGSNKSLYACEVLKEGTKIKGSLSIDTRPIEKIKNLEKLQYRKSELSWDILQKYSQEFYGLVLELEMEFYRGRPETISHLERVKSKLKDGIVLRIGKHQGYLSTTVMSIFKKFNPQLFEKIYENSVATVRPQKPKTRRISSKGLTFGWVILRKV